MSASYESLFVQVKEITSKYPFGIFLDGFDPDLINLLLRSHLDKLKKASSYETTQKLIYDAVSMHVDDYISDEPDRKSLYELLAKWRLQVLAEVEAEAKTPIPSTSSQV